MKFNVNSPIHVTFLATSGIHRKVMTPKFGDVGTSKALVEKDMAGKGILLRARNIVTTLSLALAMKLDRDGGAASASGANAMNDTTAVDELLDRLKTAIEEDTSVKKLSTEKQAKIAADKIAMEKLADEDVAKAFAGMSPSADGKKEPRSTAKKYDTLIYYCSYTSFSY